MPWSARRIVSISRSTIRDLGIHCGGGFALFSGLLLLALMRPIRGEDAETVSRVHLYQQTVVFLWFAAFMAMFATTWSLAEDRRGGRLAQWLTSPLRPAEYVIGKFFGHERFISFDH